MGELAFRLDILSIIGAFGVIFLCFIPRAGKSLIKRIFYAIFEGAFIG